MTTLKRSSTILYSLAIVLLASASFADVGDLTNVDDPAPTAAAPRVSDDLTVPTAPEQAPSVRTAETDLKLLEAQIFAPNPVSLEDGDSSQEPQPMLPPFGCGAYCDWCADLAAGACGSGGFEMTCECGGGNRRCSFYCPY